MKIYTKAGDSGKTTLMGGRPIDKFALPIEVNGDLDELNACLGIIKAHCQNIAPDVAKDLDSYQKKIIEMSAKIAGVDEKQGDTSFELEGKDLIQKMESAIDVMDQALPKLQSFVIPGEGSLSAWTHWARTVCRRAERHLARYVSELESNGQKNLFLLMFMNRLSDYLFVLARHFQNGQTITKKE